MKRYFTLLLLAIGLWAYGSPAFAEDRASLDELVTQIRQMGARFFAGTYPGYNNVQKVQAYELALSNANTALASKDAADWDALYQALSNSYDEAQNSLIPMSEGYYFFINAWSEFERLTGSRKAMLDSGSGAFGWNAFNPRDVKQVWKVTNAGDGNFFIQNVASGKYIGSVPGQGAEVPMTDDASVAQVFRHLSGSQQWNIANVENSIAYHTGNHGNGWGTSGNIVTWNTGANEASAWYAVPVSDLQLSYIQSGEASVAYKELVNAVYACDTRAYLGGSSIGYHALPEVNAFYAALQAAQEGLAGLSGYDEATLKNNLTAATTAADASLIMPGEGYFYFINAWPAFERNQQGVRKAITQIGTDILSWDTWNHVDDARQLWKISPLGDGTYSVQNVATKKFIGGASGLGGNVPMTETQTVGQIFSHLEGSNQFNLISTAFDISFHPGGHSSSGENADVISGPIVTWWGGIGQASAWYIIEETDEVLLDYLINGKTEAYRALETLVGGIEVDNPQFTVGTAPGYYDATKVSAFESALSTAKNALTQTLTDEQYTGYKTALEAAYAAARDALIPVTDGYYYFINAWSAFDDYQDVQKAMSASYDHQLIWENYAQRNPQEVWHVTALGDGTFSVQNVGTGDFIGGVAGLGSLIPMTATQSVAQIFRHLTGSTQFNICNTMNDIAYHPGGHDNGWGEKGSICTWWGDANTASAWYINPITDEDELDYIINQLAAKQKLTSLVNDPPVYQTGTDPGYYGTEEVAALNQVLSAVGSQLNQPDVDYAALTVQVDAALAAVDASRVAVTDGYYYFVSGWPLFETIQGVKKAIRAEHGSNVLTWTTYDPQDSQQLFKITCLENGNFAIQNIATGLYVKAYDGASGGVVMTETLETPQVITPYGTEPQFKICNTGDLTGYHTAGHDNGSAASGPLTIWNTSVYEASSWSIVALTDEELLEQILGAGVAQGKLEDLISKVTTYVGKFEAGDNYGDVSASEWQVMQAAIDNANGYNHSSPIKSDLEQRYEQLNAAFTTFKGQQKQFVPNQWYYIVNQDLTRVGSFKDGTDNNNIWDTFVYGNVIYATSDNTDAAGSWGEGDKNVMHWGYYKRTSADREETSGEALYRQALDPHTMWRLVPIEGQEGQYALQNRATGKYMQGYTGSEQHCLYQVNEPSPYTFELFASGQYGIRPPEAKYYLQLSGDSYLYPTNDDNRENTPWAFTLEPVEAEYLKLQVLSNSLQIMSLPYALDDEDLAYTNEGNDLRAYAIMGQHTEGTSRQLYLKQQYTFAAGEPFILSVRYDESLDPTEDYGYEEFAVPACDTYLQEGMSVNGLVATLDYEKASRAGLGVLLNNKLQATTFGQGIEGHTGYLDLSLVPVAEGTPDLVLEIPEGIDGTPVYIKDVKTTTVPTIYNLSGQRLTRLQRGVNIVNGKKVVVK